MTEQVPSKKLDVTAIKARNAEDLAVLDRDPTLPEQFDVWIAPADIRDMLAEIERLQRANADLLRRNLVLSTSPESRTYADTAGTYADSAHEPQLAASNELARRIQGLLDDYGDCPVGQLAIDEHFLREIIAALEATHEPEALRQYAPSTREDDGEFLAGQRRCAATAQRVELTRVDFFRLLSLAERGSRPAPPPSPEWWPIETAPKDGRQFLAVHNGRPFICRWATGLNGWMDAVGAGLHRDPTYWMPLPEGPTSTKGEAP